MLLKLARPGAALLACFLVTTQGIAKNDFQFREKDLALFEDVNLLDIHLQDRGFVFGDRELTDYLQGVATRLLGNRGVPERVRYQVRVLRDSSVQAFSLPNGSIYFSTGMLAVLQTEGQLSIVLARELAHVAARHQYLQNRSARNKAIVAKAAAAFSGSSLLFAICAQSFAGRWIYGAGYSSDLEIEADHEGVAMLTAAGYDPASAAQAFDLLGEKLEFEPSASPYRNPKTLEKRVQDLRNFAGASLTAHPSANSESDYLSHVASAVVACIEGDLESRRQRTAVARAQRLVTWKPDQAGYQVLLADVYRELGAKTPRPAEKELTFDGAYDRRKLLQMTPAEEQAKLLAAPGGADVKRTNEVTAEKLYRQVMAEEPTLPAAHRGLGMLYQKQGRNVEAAAEFRRYLELTPTDTPDRLRIERRLEGVTKLP